MFHQDHDELTPRLLTHKNLESATINGAEMADDATPEGFTYLDVVELFVAKYGKSKGTDYSMRFLSIMQFIEHYQKDLEQNGLIENKADSMEVQSGLLLILLESFKPPQPPNLIPSSQLFNQEHQFNFKKVIKVLRS